MCTCGCRGWCSVRPIWAMIAWSVQALQAGFYPSSRHDKEPWRKSDQGRAGMAGDPFGFRCSLVFCKGDWAEHAHTVGLPTWSSLISPCPCCFVLPEDMFDATELSPLGPPSRSKGLDDYESACSRCEIKVRLSSNAAKKLESKLAFDKTKSGNRGRCLTCDVAEHGLCKGDRVEPSDDVPDIANLTGSGKAHVTVTFWRKSFETSCRHRCPLLGRRTGASPGRSLGLDWLHALSLGVFKHWLMWFIHALLEHNAWGVSGADRQTRFELGVFRLKEELFQWYASEKRKGKQHTEVQKLLPSMLGEPGSPKFKIHGAETNSFLSFAVKELLPKRAGVLGRLMERHSAAGHSLLKILGLIRAHRRKFPDVAMIEFCKEVQRHLFAMKQLKIKCIPKHHLLIEMAGRCQK